MIQEGYACIRGGYGNPPKTLQKSSRKETERILELRWKD